MFVKKQRNNTKQTQLRFVQQPKLILISSGAHRGPYIITVGEVMPLSAAETKRVSVRRM